MPSHGFVFPPTKGDTTYYFGTHQPGQKCQAKQLELHHSLVYAFLRKAAPKMRSRKLCFRSLKHFDRDLFLADLHTVPFNVMDVFDDADHKSNFMCVAIRSLI